MESPRPVLTRRRRILVLKDGQVVEQGNHSQLMAMNGMFARMWTAQAEVAQEAYAEVPEAPEGAVAGNGATPSGTA